MSDFVNSENTKHRPDGAYGKVIEEIKKDGVCPFCPENLAKYHKKPILAEGKFWRLTENMYPYEGTKYHLLLIHREHVKDFDEITPEAWGETHHLVNEYFKQEKIPGGAFLMRFGDTKYTGASVSHLHINVISADIDRDDRKPILARIG